ncbi:MAG: PSD1 domain-containing protein [Verrucomicrobia bacterium]|nr:PSD1 domain-containing protein [Verrucomicrobiota bacterium]
MNRITSLLLLASLFGASASAIAALTSEQIARLPQPAARRVEFSKDIKPILQGTCAQCHGRGKSKGGLRIDTRETFIKGGETGPAAVPGDSAKSLVVELVSGFNPDMVMPQKGSKLKPEQVALLRAWIDQGLPWDKDVFFGKIEPLNLKPRRPAVPSAAKGSGLTNPVDLLLQPYFAAHKTKPTKVVDDRAFARRVFLDIIGVLPAPEELVSFAADKDPRKRERLVARLLADNERYAAHWLTFWNDALRNDYRGTGYIDGGRKQITAWLWRALHDNLPYDRFVAQLVNPAPDAEGFTKGIVWRGVVNASQTPQMQAAQNIGQVFMGANLKCASCHDSFVSDWTLADSYGLAGVYADGPLEIAKCDKPTGQQATARFLYPELGAMDPAAPKAERVRRLAEIITCKENGRLTRTIVNRLWAKFMGRGLVEPVDEMDGKSWNADLLDWLASDLVDNGYDLKKTLARIVTSRAYQLPAVGGSERTAKDYVFRGPVVRRMTAEQFRDAITLLTGIGQAKPDAKVQLPAGVASNIAVRASLLAADPLTTALGRPNREQVVTSRPSAATTLQALELTNGNTLADALKRGAEKLMGGGVGGREDGRELIDQLYLRALGRKPTADELRLAQGFVGKPLRAQGVEDLLWAMTMLPEFQLIY